MNKINYDYSYIVNKYIDSLDLANKTIITYGVTGYTVPLINKCNSLGLKLVLVASANNDLSNITDVELISIPSYIDLKEEKLMAKDMALDLENSIVIDFIDNKEISSIIFKTLKNTLPTATTVYLDFISSTEVNGLSKLFKIRDDSIVYLLKEPDKNVDMDLIDGVKGCYSDCLDDDLIITM